MRAELRSMPEELFFAEDFLDDDGVTDDPIRIAVSIAIRPGEGAASIDFAGSSPQCAARSTPFFPSRFPPAFMSSAACYLRTRRPPRD